MIWKIFIYFFLAWNGVKANDFTDNGEQFLAFTNLVCSKQVFGPSTVPVQNTFKCFKLPPFNIICLTCFFFQNHCPNLYVFKTFQQYFGDMIQPLQDWKTKQNIGNMREKLGPCHLKDHPEKFKLPQEKFQAFQVNIFYLAMQCFAFQL